MPVVASTHQKPETSKGLIVDEFGALPSMMMLAISYYLRIRPVSHNGLTVRYITSKLDGHCWIYDYCNKARKNTIFIFQ
jgi:hypothetical protein